LAGRPFFSPFKNGENGENGAASERRCDSTKSHPALEHIPFGWSERFGRVAAKSA